MDGWLTKDEEGRGMERALNNIVNALCFLLFYILFIFGGVRCWLCFGDRIKTVLLTVQNFIFG